MIRTKHSRKTRDEFITIPSALVRKLFKEGSDVVTLYMFYLHTANWQDTDQPRATDTYCMEGLSWGKQKFYTAKSYLKKHRLIEQIQRGGTKHRFGEYYIKLNDRYTQNRSPLKNKVNEDTTGSSVAAETRINSAVDLKPVDLDQQSNAYKENKNASTLSGRRPTSVRPPKPPTVCPHGHVIGKDYTFFPECKGCVVWEDCDELSLTMCW